MPDFNTFRTNKLLLGQVLVARQNVDLSATENDHLEVRQFLHELEEKKRKETSTLFLRFIVFFTGIFYQFNHHSRKIHQRKNQGKNRVLCL
jgi:hypothetical protein